MVGVAARVSPPRGGGPCSARLLRLCSTLQLSIALLRYVTHPPSAAQLYRQLCATVLHATV